MASAMEATPATPAEEGWASFRSHSFSGSPSPIRRPHFSSSSDFPDDLADSWESWESGSTSLLTDRVVGVKELEELSAYNSAKLCPGDILLRIGSEGPGALDGPFPKGLESVNAEFARRKAEKVPVLVRRGRDLVEVTADIQAGYLYTRLKGVVLEEGPESRFRMIFENCIDARMEQEERSRQNKINRLNEMVQLISTSHDLLPNPKTPEGIPPKLADGMLVCAYTIMVLPFEVPNTRSMFSLPKLCDFAHTSQRALNWFNNALGEGSNLRFLSIQSEPLPGTIRRDGWSSDGKYDARFDEVAVGGRWQSFVNDSDMHIIRACRLAYAPVREVQVQMQTSADVKSFGIVLSRTTQGFVRVVEVQPAGLAASCGVLDLLNEARAAGKELLLLRLQGQSAVPSMISDSDHIYTAKLTAIMQSMMMFAQLQQPLWVSLGI